MPDADRDRMGQSEVASSPCLCPSSTGPTKSSNSTPMDAKPAGTTDAIVGVMSVGESTKSLKQQSKTFDEDQINHNVTRQRCINNRKRSGQVRSGQVRSGSSGRLGSLQSLFSLLLST